MKNLTNYNQSDFNHPKSRESCRRIEKLVRFNSKYRAWLEEQCISSFAISPSIALRFRKRKEKPTLVKITSWRRNTLRRQSSKLRNSHFWRKLLKTSRLKAPKKTQRWFTRKIISKKAEVGKLWVLCSKREIEIIFKKKKVRIPIKRQTMSTSTQGTFRTSLKSKRHETYLRLSCSFLIW